MHLKFSRDQPLRLNLQGKSFLFDTQLFLLSSNFKMSFKFSQYSVAVSHCMYTVFCRNGKDNYIQDHDLFFSRVPNGNNDYLIISILKPYVTKTYSKKVEIYGLLFEKKLILSFSKGNALALVCVSFLLQKLQFLLWSAFVQSWQVLLLRSF